VIPVLINKGYDRDLVMVARVRFFSVLAAMLVAAAVLVPVGAPSLRGSTPIYPTLYVNYTDDCTFSIVNDAGQPVTSIAPGAYQVDVITPIQFRIIADQNVTPNSLVGCGGYVQFQLTGPGVNLSTTLITGCEDNLTLPVTTFQPNSSYVAEDLNNLAATRTTVTVTASGSAPSVTRSTPPTTTNETGGGLSALGTPLKATSGVATVGSLSATVSADGALALRFKGKPVTRLAAGRYTITAIDKSKRGGFILEQAHHAAKTVTGIGFVGTHTTTLTLSAGQWFFAPSSGGKKTYFVVAG
jgi:hypothetical protein